ncbi:hypothetical protein NPIL_585231 [Nephila pilipes]|uniref:Uncharacterized protein n=1 Tax=Nephila pilipes TaxID=299642 RepID=A0A8X6TWD0_NEPPI|nr:hypothetical protein NPIL_585231 [Nephila pilipes]
MTVSPELCLRRSSASVIAEEDLIHLTNIPLPNTWNPQSRKTELVHSTSSLIKTDEPAVTVPAVCHQKRNSLFHGGFTSLPPFKVSLEEDADHHTHKRLKLHGIIVFDLAQNNFNLFPKV